MLKRAFDLCASAAGLAVLAPLFAACAIAIKLDSPGPVLFRQQRVGRYGKLFTIHKFRTMVNADAKGAQVTHSGDPRITRVGRVLRNTKIDELPQLLDVLIGNMSLVGPRPEVPRYVELYPAEFKATVLSVRPGITDPASIEFRDEEKILASAEDPERYYVDIVLPRKLKLAAQYVVENTFWGDLRIIMRTLHRVADTP